MDKVGSPPVHPLTKVSLTQRLTPAPATQGGVTLGPEQGELEADFMFKPIGYVKYQLLACCIGMTGFIARLAAANQHYKSFAIAFTVLGGICVGFLEPITILMSSLVCKPRGHRVSKRLPRITATSLQYNCHH
jgi:Fungal trichothecene efflux pump (TRI12)